MDGWREWAREGRETKTGEAERVQWVGGGKGGHLGNPAPARPQAHDNPVPQ